MNILVVGHRGQLGHDVMAQLAQSHRPTGIDLPEVDITDAQSIDAAVTSGRPDAIVNCAAFTAVDACESQRENAWAANAEGPGHLAKAAARAGALLVHISTDYVFDGLRPVPRPYFEEDPPQPATYYGITKLAGEQAVADNCDRWAILRTAWLYGAHGRNFLKTILTHALAQRPLKVVADQIGCPTWSHSLARQIRAVVEANATGRFHATGSGHCSWYEFACRFLEKMNVAHEIAPCSTSEYPTAAVRPANSILGSRRLQTAGIYAMRPWQEDLDRFVARYADDLIREVTNS